jgi:hypothetical protein
MQLRCWGLIGLVLVGCTNGDPSSTEGGVASPASSDGGVDRGGPIAVDGGSGGGVPGSGGAGGSGGTTGGGLGGRGGATGGSGGIAGTGGSAGDYGGPGGSGGAGVDFRCSGVASGTRGPFGPIAFERLIKSSVGTGDLVVLQHQNGAEPTDLPFSLENLVRSPPLYLPSGWHLVVYPGHPDVVWTGISDSKMCHEGDAQTPWPPPSTSWRCGGIAWQDPAGARSDGPLGPMTITHLIGAEKTATGIPQVLVIPPPALGHPVPIKASDLTLPYDLPPGWRLVGAAGNSFWWNGTTSMGCQ